MLGAITEDTNNDGVGEDPIAGVVVELFEDTDGDGQPDGVAIASTTTGTDGSYSFSGVAPGDYVVVETQPAGFDTVTDVDSTLPGDDVANGSAVDNAIPVSIASGETDDGNNFVEEQPGVIAGAVTEDTNNDGVGEDPIAALLLSFLRTPMVTGNLMGRLLRRGPPGRMVATLSQMLRLVMTLLLSRSLLVSIL